jgi:1-acyl-sn-glycerol-3-phosphate acyltransferase
MTTGDFLYPIVKGPIKLYYKLALNIKENINEAKDYKGPLFIIGPHTAEEDSQIAILYRQSLVRFLAADANWDVGWKSNVFKLFNVIPIARQRLDVKAIRKLKSTVEQGHSVGLFPEGQRTWDGKTMDIIKSTAKLVKLLKVPVYNINYKGLYLSRPRWAERNGRRGKVELDIKQIFSKEEIEKASKDEVLNSMINHLDYNEFDWQRKAMVSFKGKNRAEYIERLLYKCPECKSINSFWSKGDEFSCDKCNAKYSVNEFGFIEGCKKFDNTVDWHEWQKPAVRELAKKGFSFKQIDIQIERVYDDGLIKENADIVFNNSGLDISFKSGEKQFIPIEKAQSCNAVYGDRVEIYFEGIKHRFLFEPLKRHMSVKLFEDLVRYLYNQKIES